MRFGLVTCKNLPEPDPDHAPLRDALTDRGHVAELVPWDVPRVDDGFDLYVLRSTWNYYKAAEAFLTWCEEAHGSVGLVNSPSIVRWNHDKRYLAEIQRRGVDIVPTRWLVRGSDVDVKAIISESRWRKVVIKPCISAGSFRTKWFEAEDTTNAEAFTSELLAERDIMIQQYVEGFTDPGERSLIWIDGEWTHAVRKRPRFAGEVERVESAKLDEEEVELASRAIDPLLDQLYYARVDLVRDEGNQPVVSEVELIEPSLFFDLGPGSLTRFVSALEKAVEQRRADSEAES